MALQESFLEEKLATLERAKNWSPRLISKLETLIRNGQDEDLFRINPLVFASEKNSSESEVIDLFLYATKLAIFEMEWQLVCPICGYIVDSLRELSGVHGHIHCAFCQLEADLNLDDYIIVTFTISPEARPIRFHQTQDLPLEELYYKVLFYQHVRPMHGMAHQDVLRMITRLLSQLPPQGNTSIELDAGGLLGAKDLLNKKASVFFVPQSETNDMVHLRLQRQSDKMHATEVPTGEVEADYGIARFRFQSMGQIPQGKLRVELENHTDSPSPICLVQYPLGFIPEILALDASLTGKRLLTCQSFRDLFRSETVSQDEGLGIKDICFLFTDLKGSTAMYDQIGDPKAYFLVRQHFEILTKSIAGNRGAIVKTIGDAVMASFMGSEDALKAAVEMLRDMRTFNETVSQPLHLKIGIHHGHSIAVSLNERLDYFGQTVNIAARVQGLADADEIYITQEVWDKLDDKSILDSCESSALDVSVKGVSDMLHVHRLGLKS